MERKLFGVGIIWRLIIILILTLGLVHVCSAPATAQSISDYFDYSYSWEFSETDISEGESFSVTVIGTATCNNDLPATPSQARIVSRVVAEHPA